MHLYTFLSLGLSFHITSQYTICGMVHICWILGFDLLPFSFASCSSAFLYPTIGSVVCNLEVPSTSTCPISYPTPTTPPRCILCNAGMKVWCDSTTLANGSVEGQGLAGKSSQSGQNLGISGFYKFSKIIHC